MRLQGRIAFVTGAGQGNGAAIARGLAAEGAKLIVTDIALDTAERTAEEIRAKGGEAWAYTLDVTDAPASKALAKEIAASVGNVSIVVNNAGVCPRHTIDSPDLERAWNLAMDINLKGA